MPWFRIDDGFADHPKVVQCSLASIGLWTKAGAWCSKHLTDGKVPKGMLRTWGATPRLATELVAAGLWSVTAEGYEFHEWSGRNPTRAEVLAARKTDADRKREERRATPRVRTDNPNGVQPDAPRTPDGEKSESDGTSHARARVPVPAPPVPTEAAEAAAARSVPVLTSALVARSWHRAISLNGTAFGVVHAESRWRSDYEIIGSAIMATFEQADWAAVADAVCEYFWLAPSGPVGSGRVLHGKANPGMLAKHVTRDLEAANEWAAQRRQEAAQ